MNDTFLKACRGEATDYTPIWMMRQAGRYLPEYQKVRGNVTFLELCKSPELCVEVTLQPIDIFDMDAAILFSDILIPMEAMGLKLEFHEGRGPVFPDVVRDQSALDNLGDIIGVTTTDDILDVISDTETLGKPSGSDEKMQKPTYPSILGLDASRKLAMEQHELALSHLEALDTRADTLRQLSAYIVEREH